MNPCGARLVIPTKVQRAVQSFWLNRLPKYVISVVYYNTMIGKIQVEGTMKLSSPRKEMDCYIILWSFAIQRREEWKDSLFLFKKSHKVSICFLYHAWSAPCPSHWYLYKAHIQMNKVLNLYNAVYSYSTWNDVHVIVKVVMCVTSHDDIAMCSETLTISGDSMVMQYLMVWLVS